jgi:hypothetical protein
MPTSECSQVITANSKHVFSDLLGCAFFWFSLRGSVFKTKLKLTLNNEHKDLHRVQQKLGRFDHSYIREELDSDNLMCKTAQRPPYA